LICKRIETLGNWSCALLDCPKSSVEELHKMVFGDKEMLYG